MTNDTPVPPRPAPFEALFRRLAAWRRSRITSKVDHADVAAYVAEGAPVTNRYNFMVVMACGIAILACCRTPLP